ncbi:hypothetical protein ATANTOWER_031650 [Ataeniobius toweri]|uniref:Uncharacterized protein n=1 Tax=Ataeniobius toweri TaxID=208326 RepID=A0ABU7BDD8_9TELE|nr:hypothetical protein [Ataeniobius toweri]
MHVPVSLDPINSQTGTECSSSSFSLSSTKKSQTAKKVLVPKKKKKKKNKTKEGNKLKKQPLDCTSFLNPAAVISGKSTVDSLQRGAPAEGVGLTELISADAQFAVLR